MNDYESDFDDRLNDLEARVESIESMIQILIKRIDNIHPVIYNIQNSEKK